MCGITGFVDFNKKCDKNVLLNMTRELYRRGPDDFDNSFYDTKNLNVGLGHRRLSILGLSENGKQPMRFEHLELVFNGEVYNFKEIRKELVSFGYAFHTETDTEVVLKSFHYWGHRALTRFVGMFAIALYDNLNDKVFLYRDRAGVKPLYFYWNKGLFAFSSELKSLHQNPLFEKKLNTDSLSLYFKYGYIPAPHSIFKNTEKLLPGSYLELDLKSKTLEIKLYWNLYDFTNLPKLDVSYKEAEDEVERLIIKSCDYRMVSDVPVGVFLSGGYDSSLITSIIQANATTKINTFTIGFENNKYNEAPFAKNISKYLGTQHTEYICTQKEAIDLVTILPEVYDEPFGDISSIPTLLVSKIAKQSVKVALSADGGDELFAGYSKYKGCLKYSKFQFPSNVTAIAHGILNNFNGRDFGYINKAKRLCNIATKQPEESYLKFMSFANDQVIDNLILNDISKLKTGFDTDDEILDDDLINKLCAVDFKTYMVDDVLVKVDRATMYNGLEGREPLLDQSLIEYVAQLPSSYKLNDGDSKFLLKNITHKYLPKEMVDRPKMGFDVPIHAWLHNELNFLIQIYLSAERIKKEGVLNYIEIKKLLVKFNAQPLNKDLGKLVWFLINFEMWYEKWM
jgi:asparagine synthase (glutamine-hydrolysing)